MRPSEESPAAPLAPLGVSHVVINVRDLEASHRFYTDLLGFRMTAEWKSSRPPHQRMRFYAGQRSGVPSHHDLALVEMPNLPPPPAQPSRAAPSPLNHLGVRMPDRESWLAQLRYLRSRGVPFHRRINHGMSHSVYIWDPDGYGIEVLYDLPPEVWQGDINAALNHVEPLPVEEDVPLEDRTDYPVFTKA